MIEIYSNDDTSIDDEDQESICLSNQIAEKELLLESEEGRISTLCSNPGSRLSSYCDDKGTYSSMCPTDQISFKLYDWNPAEFLRRLRLRSGCRLPKVRQKACDKAADSKDEAQQGKEQSVRIIHQGLAFVSSSWSTGFQDLLAFSCSILVHETSLRIGYSFEELLPPFLRNRESLECAEYIGEPTEVIEPKERTGNPTVGRTSTISCATL